MIPEFKEKHLSTRLVIESCKKSSINKNTKAKYFTAKFLKAKMLQNQNNPHSFILFLWEDQI